jgi:Skp family chaperone for outer membrane proteins
VKRSTALFLALAAIPLAIAIATAQTPPATTPPAAAPASRGTAVFNVPKVMREYQKWQFFAQEVNKDRQEKAALLAKKQNELVDLQNKIKVEPVKAKQDEMAQQMIVLQRQLEDMEKQARKEIDEKSMTHLRTLFGELRTVVDAVAKTNGFDLVLAYPDASTPEEMASPMYLEMKLRTPAAMPFYVSPNIDITAVVIQTLNKNFPAPGPVSPAGATTPAPAPGAPPVTPPATPGKP